MCRWIWGPENLSDLEKKPKPDSYNWIAVITMWAPATLTLVLFFQLHHNASWTCPLSFVFASEICKHKENLPKSTVIESGIATYSPPLELGSKIIFTFLKRVIHSFIHSSFIWEGEHTCACARTRTHAWAGGKGRGRGKEGETDSPLRGAVHPQAGSH